MRSKLSPRRQPTVNKTAKSVSLRKLRSWDASTTRTLWNYTKYSSQKTPCTLFLSFWLADNFTIRSNPSINSNLNKRGPSCMVFWKDCEKCTQRVSCIETWNQKTYFLEKKENGTALSLTLVWLSLPTLTLIFLLDAVRPGTWPLRWSISRTWRQNILQSAISTVWALFSIYFCMEKVRSLAQPTTKSFLRTEPQTSTSTAKNTTKQGTKTLSTYSPWCSRKNPPIEWLPNKP